MEWEAEESQIKKMRGGSDVDEKAWIEGVSRKRLSRAYGSIEDVEKSPTRVYSQHSESRAYGLRDEVDEEYQPVVR